MHTHLKNNIKQQLISKSMSVSELERLAGLKQSSVQNILHGRSKNPSVETIRSIAQQLNCSMETLLSMPHHTPAPAIQEDTPPWNAPLFIKAIEAVQALLDKQHKTLSHKQALACIEEVYKYSIGLSDEIDLRFAKWILDKLGSD